MKQAVLLLALLCLLVPALGCDKASPVAPAGSILSLSANPSKIGLNGSSTITVVGRKPDGNPLNPGTEIRLSSDLGTLSPSIVEVDSGGRATATLRGDGRSGPAKITAATADATVETTIQIGESAETKPSLLLSVSPNSIETEESATITIIARNSDGTPAPSGQQIILTSTLGTISPTRVTTRNDGTATATFTAGTLAGSAEIRAVMGSSEPATTTVTIRDIATDISLSANPASVPQTGTPASEPIEITAVVINAQQQVLQNVLVTFSSQLGELSDTTAFTDSSGRATVMLEITEAQIDSFSGGSFVVTAQTPGAGGDFLTKNVVIDIEGQ
jgi:hypothetical protein